MKSLINTIWHHKLITGFILQWIFTLDNVWTYEMQRCVYSLISSWGQQTSQLTPLVLELSIIWYHLLWDNSSHGHITILSQVGHCVMSHFNLQKTCFSSKWNWLVYGKSWPLLRNHLELVKLINGPFMVFQGSNISGLDNKDKDKDKDVFIGPKEFVSHMMMTQTKYRLYHQLK